MGVVSDIDFDEKGGILVRLYSGAPFGHKRFQVDHAYLASKDTECPVEVGDVIAVLPDLEDYLVGIIDSMNSAVDCHKAAVLTESEMRHNRNRMSGNMVQNLERLKMLSSYMLKNALQVYPIEHRTFVYLNAVVSGKKELPERPPSFSRNQDPRALMGVVKDSLWTFKEDYQLVRLWDSRPEEDRWYYVPVIELDKDEIVMFLPENNPSILRKMQDKGAQHDAYVLSLIRERDIEKHFLYLDDRAMLYFGSLRHNRPKPQRVRT